MDGMGELRRENLVFGIVENVIECGEDRLVWTKRADGDEPCVGIQDVGETRRERHLHGGGRKQGEAVRTAKSVFGLDLSQGLLIKGGDSLLQSQMVHRNDSKKLLSTEHTEYTEHDSFFVYSVCSVDINELWIVVKCQNGVGTAEGEGGGEGVTGVVQGQRGA